MDYPVGLLTADEVMLAGADNQRSNNESYYLYSGNSYWTGSVALFGLSGGTHMAGVNSGGYMAFFAGILGIRPSISLKPGFTVTDDGDGTTGSPYIVS